MKTIEEVSEYVAENALYYAKGGWAYGVRVKGKMVAGHTIDDLINKVCIRLNIPIHHRY